MNTNKIHSFAFFNIAIVSCSNHMFVGVLKEEVGGSWVTKHPADPSVYSAVSEAYRSPWPSSKPDFLFSSVLYFRRGFRVFSKEANSSHMIWLESWDLSCKFESLRLASPALREDSTLTWYSWLETWLFVNICISLGIDTFCLWNMIRWFHVCKPGNLLGRSRWAEASTQGKA